MGLYIKNHENYDGPLVSGNSGRSGQVDYAAQFINQGSSIFGTLLARSADGKGGSDDDKEVKISKKTQKEIDKLQKEIDAILKEANVASADELKNAVTTSEETQKTLSGNIDKINLDISVKQQIIDDYPAKKADLDSQLNNAQDDSAKQAIQAKIDTLNTEKKNAQKEIENLKKQIEQLEDKLKAEKAEYSIKLTQLSEVENYQHQIDKLQNKDLPKEVTYDVAKETKDLSAFMDALKKFKENPNVQTAANLYDAYKGDGNGVDNPTAKKAYDMVTKQYPDLFEKVQLAKK